ncbi:MAG: hypothetical protein HC880_18145 [Bacteroidia bacterium]|nr:hypothetical protein [Bacteroidia bacterium]
MIETTEQLIKQVEHIIDTLELHTLTRPGKESKRAVIDAFKHLYTLKSYLEQLTSMDKSNHCT